MTTLSTYPSRVEPPPVAVAGRRPISSSPPPASAAGLRALSRAGEASFDRTVLFLVGALMTLGVVMVYSASGSVQAAAFDLRRWWETPLRQGVFAMAGFLAMALAAHADPRWLSWERSRGLAPWGLFLVALALLAAVLIPGIGAERLGAQRTILVFRGGFSLGFQPAEIAKVVMVIWLAALLGRPGAELGSFWRGYLPAFGSALLLIGLTGIEDYGTAALMGLTAMAMLLLAGARGSHLIGTGLLGLAAGVGLLLLKPHRLQRLHVFLSPADPSSEGYQVMQSLIAIGSGGWWGRGLGAGVQKYGYLPQDNNDFIFAILCEELGVVGGLAVIALFLLLLWRGWRLWSRAADSFCRLLAAGITLTLCLQAAMNIAVVTNSVPTKGISLPFVSAGGSGVLFLGLAAGLLSAVRRDATAGLPARRYGYEAAWRHT